MAKGDQHETAIPASGVSNPGDEARPGSPQTGEDICPDCNGTGFLKGQPCPNCGGTGRVTKIVGDA